MSCAGKCFQIPLSKDRSVANTRHALKTLFTNNCWVGESLARLFVFDSTRPPFCAQ